MEDRNKNTEMEQEEILQPEETEGESQEQPEEVQQGLPNRSCVLMFIAGLYLLYTGWQLCQNVLKGVEGGNWGFFAAGVGFFIVGAVMLFISGKNFLRREKEKKEAEARELQNHPLPEDKPQERKAMTIAERARLAEGLSDREDGDSKETAENVEAGEKTEEI